MVAAVNVTGTPEQTGFAEGDIAIFTGTNGIIDIVIEFEVAGLPEPQAIFEVRRQVIISPLSGVNINAVLFVPASIPLTFQ
jgi:hypothetical protein